MGRMINALIKACNEQSRFPQAIFFIPGPEFLKSIDHVDFGGSMIIGKCLDWLISNIE